MKLTEAQISGRAAQIITIAMGTRTTGRGRGTKRIRCADDDPLAFWLGVEAIMQLIEDAGRAGRIGSDTKIDDIYFFTGIPIPVDLPYLVGARSVGELRVNRSAWDKSRAVSWATARRP